MTTIIRNRDSLLDHGDAESRRIVLDIAERTLTRLNAYERIRQIVHREGTILRIGERSWDLARKRHIYLFGAGKACNAMAMAIDEIMGDWLTDGIAIVKVSEPGDRFHKTRVFVGGHPLPNETGMQACREIVGIVDQSGPDDLFLVVMSGGSSALMSLPIEGISLQDEVDTTDILLKSGANIFDINAIRRHISQMNGGMLAKRIQARGGTLIGFGISDAIASPPTGDISVPYARYRATPMGPDQTTLEDARRVIRDYQVADRLPRSVVDYLMTVGPEGETPKAFPENTYYLVNTVPDSCRYAREIAAAMGIPAIILSSFLDGEAKDIGTVMAAIAREIQVYGNPVPAPCVILSAGEAVTTILDNRQITGHGGPGQEMVTGFALAAGSVSGACLLSIDSEGTDGTTAVAGGITDSQTAGQAVEQGVDLRAALRGHASFEALDALGDTVYTGNTGTNLCDFNILYVPDAGNGGKS